MTTIPADADRQRAHRIGAALRARRRAAGATQTDVARALGVSQAAVSCWEGGSRTISSVDLLRVAEALGCAAAELLPEGA